jgi:membrane-associated protein
MNEQMLAAVESYGSPALFAIVAIAAVGVPLPVTLLLIVTGSLAAQGAMHLWPAIAVAAAGSVAGDQIGYAIGRWGSNVVVARFSGMLGNAARLRSLDAKAKSWGGAGVFFSRWLVSPLGPWINLASGAADYSWFRFTLWDFLGESFGAALYIWLGQVFSDRVQAVGAILGDLTWAIVGVVAAAFLGWKLFFRREPESR